MSTNSIIEKLNIFFENHQALNEECQVIYILVEVRKLLEIANNKNFPILNFYSDWALHTTKTRNMKAIKPIVQDMYNSAKVKILTYPPGWNDTEKDALFKFTYMDDLRVELKRVFLQYNIKAIFTEFGLWTPFLIMLVKILEEQPIITPISDVKEIIFLPATDRCCHLRLAFSNPIQSPRGEKYNFFELKNAF